MRKKDKKIILVLSILITLFLGLVFFAWTVVPNLQMVTFYKNLRIFINRQQEEKLLNSKFTYYPMTYVQSELRYKFAEYIFRAFLEKDNPSKEFVVFAKDKLEESARKENNYANNFLALGKAYDLLADLYPDQQVLMRLKAEENYKKALKLLPDMQTILYALSVNLTNQRKTDEALVVSKKAVEEDPRVAESHYYYGIMLFNKGSKQNMDESLKEMEIAFQNNFPANSSLARGIYEKLLSYYYDKKDIFNLKTVLNRLIYLNENQADVYKKIIKYMDDNKIVPILNLRQ
ncbi:MAG: hypothetical protein WCO07_01660 [bacterium]